jgi:hypothetical protein
VLPRDPPLGVKKPGAAQATPAAVKPVDRQKVPSGPSAIEYCLTS